MISTNSECVNVVLWIVLQCEVTYVNHQYHPRIIKGAYNATANLFGVCISALMSPDAASSPKLQDIKPNMVTKALRVLTIIIHSGRKHARNNARTEPTTGHETGQN